MNKGSDAIAAERILAIARTLGIPRETQDGIPIEFYTKLREVLLKDPDLPKADPTVSLWQEPAHPTVASAQSPILPKYTDYAVIGSGITGCSVAKGLLESNSLNVRNGEPPHVTVLEARTLASGATGRNGGHFVSPAGHYYSSLAKRHGEKAAADICRFSILNVETIMDVVRGMDPKIAEESQLRDVLKVTTAVDEGVWRDFEKSLTEFRRALPEHLKYHTTTQMQDVPEKWNLKGCFGSIEHMSGAVWPYRLVASIFADLLNRYPYNLAIETNTPVTSVETIDTDLSSLPGSDYKYIITTLWGKIYAKQVIHCTNGHAAHLLKPLLGKLHPFRGTMSVQKAAPGVSNFGDKRSWSAVFPTSLDANTGLYTEGLFYLQQNANNGDIWVGHECSKIFETIQGDDSYVSKEAYEALLKFLPTFMRDWPEGVQPDLKGIWTGIQGHTSDGLPIVGKLPESLTGRSGSEGEWFAGGYSGYGMDKAWLSGQALVKMVAGEGVPEWLPDCFLINVERMRKLSLERSIAKWVSIARTGHW